MYKRIFIQTRMSSSEINTLHRTADSKQQTKQCCKYRVRWFYSKGAALVLFWFLLMSTSANSLYNIYKNCSNIKLPFPNWALSVVTGALLLVATPLFGWLADTRLGNYKVIRTGFVLLFLASIFNSLVQLILNNTSPNTVVITLLFVITFTLYWTGLVASCFNLFQLGLDQMPEASSTNTTSFIAWVVITFSFGFWIGDVFGYLQNLCIVEESYSIYLQIWTLLPVLCTCLILCSIFSPSPKWLIVEPKSPQFLKLIFRVLKFAKKHNAPIRRSALTYWEEDIPSRMDLGKSKYGGPFTTEQVEDVKTFLRILAVSVPIWIIAFAMSLHQRDNFLEELKCSSFTSYLLHICIYHPWLWTVIGTLLTEFLVYPLFKYRLPSILKRIGITSFVAAICNIFYMILTIYFHYNNSIAVWPMFTYSILYGLLLSWLFTSAFEFVCAQSPYRYITRGLLSGHAVFIYGSSYFGAILYSIGFSNICHKAYCSIIYTSLATALSIIGFILHCILARWYKRRVRDEDYHPQRVVEEVYDRYLSATH